MSEEPGSGQTPESASASARTVSTTPNLLYYGDNLEVLRQHTKDETVDLVYLDPSFKSNKDYNILFAEHGKKAAASG